MPEYIVLSHERPRTVPNPTDAATAYEFPSLQRDYILFVASTFKPLMQ